MAKTLLMLNVGDKVKDPSSKWLGYPVAFQVADLLHQGYPLGSVTLCTEQLISLYAFDAAEPQSAYEDQQTQGNNAYWGSNIFYWINSESPSGKWYHGANESDAPPDEAGVTSCPYQHAPGFLSGFSQDFKKALLPTKLTVARSTVSDIGGSESVPNCRFFLPSNTEVGVANQGGIAEGSRLALFSTDAARQRCISKAAVESGNFEGTPEPGIQPWPWRTRTPVVSTSGQVCTVLASGQGNMGFPANQGGSIGILACCNLFGNTRVSDQPDEDGYYTLLWDEPEPQKAEDLLVGDLLKIRLGGKERLAAVLKQGKPSAIYDDSCDGVWCMTLESLGSELVGNEYYTSMLYHKLGNDYFFMTDLNLRPYLKTVKLPYISTATTVVNGANGIDSRFFLLSAIEVNTFSSYKDGAVLPYFSGAGATQRRICTQEGEAVEWFTRTLYYVSSYYCKEGVQKNGARVQVNKSNPATYGIRPAFVLEKSAPLRREEDGSFSVLLTRGTATLGELSAGDRVKEPNSLYLGKPVVWQLADKDHAGHPADSVALISDKILCFKPFDAIEAGAASGNTRYGYSNLRKWLNSQAGPGQWYMPAHSGDRPPSDAYVFPDYGNAYEDEAGFLHDFAPAFRSAMLTVPITADIGSASTTTELLHDKIFLASISEFNSQAVPVEEGTLFPLFNLWWLRNRCATPEAIAASTSPAKPADSDALWGFWFRSSGSANQGYVSSGGGQVLEHPAYGKAGVLPFCCLPKSAKISNTQGEDGCFTLIFNELPQAPQISPLTSGRRVETGFSMSFLPACDADGDKQYFSVELSPDSTFSSGVTRFSEGLEKWNGEAWEPAGYGENADAGTLFRIPVSGLPINADLYARVGAWDREGSGYTSYSPIVLLHTGTTLEFKTLPVPRERQPRYAFPLVSGQIAPETGIEMKICNNALDELPAWEDCTEAYQKDKVHIFQNKSKTAESWAVQLHVILKAEEASGEISVGAVGLGLS